MKTFLAIGGHIGDMELTCGCVLATESLKGNKIVTLALTAGERGNPKGVTTADYKKQKINEAKEFAKMLGVEALVLDYPDGDLPYNEEVVFKVAQIIRDVRPNVIFTHWKKSMHKDHEATNKIVKDASFLASVYDGKSLKGEACYAPVYYCENWEDRIDFNPYLMVDCSLGYDLWCEAISKHYFIMHSTSFRYYDYYTHLTYVRGCLNKTLHAQCFDIEDYQKFQRINF